MDTLQTRVHELTLERDRLQLMAVDTSVAGILMSMAGISSSVSDIDADSLCLKSSSSRNDLTNKFEELQKQATLDLSEEESNDINFELLSRNKV